MKIRSLLLSAGALLAGTALVATFARQPDARAALRPKKHLLVVTVTKGFRHDSIPVAEQTIEMLGTKTGAWDTDFVRTDEEMQQKMTPAGLQHYDAIVFANTTGVLPLPDPNAFLAYIWHGHGFVATHSGSDTFHQWPNSSASVSAYVQMLGAEFQTHHSQCAIDAHILDTNHPATRPVVNAAQHGAKAGQTADLKQHTNAIKTAQGPIWQAFDEIYLFKNIDRSSLHVLLALDKHPDDGSPEANQPGEYLVSWCKNYGTGRVFYTSLGHRQEMWHDPIYQQHLTGGILFALGLEKGDTEPNPPLSASR
jgi:type 1 glutamine amidotransferase